MTILFRGFPGGLDSKESACSAGDPGSIPGWGRSLGGENGNPLQYCLQNPTEEPGRLQSLGSQKELDMTERLTQALRILLEEW